MPQALVPLSDEEHKKVVSLSDKWKIPQYEAIKRIIREFKVQEMRKT